MEQRFPSKRLPLYDARIFLRHLLRHEFRGASFWKSADTLFTFSTELFFRRIPCFDLYQNKYLSTMKFNAAIFCLLGSATAFVPKTSLQQRSYALFMQDTSEAVKAAMDASETYGKTSPEAKAAWALLEELDAANR